MNGSSAVASTQALSTDALGDAPATRKQRYWAIVLCGSLLICAALAGHFGLHQGPEVKAFLPITVTFWSLADVLTAFLLLAQFCVNGRVSFAILAFAYALSGILTWCYLLAFPGLFVTRALTPGELDISIYLWIVWHCTFPALIMVSMHCDSNMKRPVVSRRMIPRGAFITCTLPLVVAVGIAALVFVVRDSLPHLLVGGIFQPLFETRILPGVAIANLICSGLLLARRKDLTALQLWLCVALFSACLEAMLNLCGGSRYSYAWDIGKLITVCSASILLVMILCENVSLYARLAQEITDRKELERVRSALLERVTLATQAGQVGVWDWDIVAERMTWDSTMFALYGIQEPARHATFEDWHGALHPDDLERAVRELEAGIAGSAPFNTEFRIRWPSGEVRNIRALSTVVRDDAGNALRIVGTNWDMTEVRRLAEELRGEKERLSEVALELIAANHLAEEANRASLSATESKSLFLATMSHEIRTPMNGLIGTTELLSLSNLSREQHRYVEVVRDSGQSLLRLLNDILDFSKIEAGKLDLEIMDFDLRGQISSVASLLGPPFKTKGVTLITDVDSNIPINVQGDPYRLRQILLNLVGNALKFTPAGGTVRIFVATGPTNGEANTVRFTIVDSGIGMASDVRERLFQPFSQADGSTTRKYGGTGLGLSISKQLVDLMSGQIGVESPLEGGSAFWFAVPFLPANSAERAALMPLSTTGDRRSFVRPRCERILLAEDDEVSRFLAVRQFKQLGFDVTVVPNGREAVNSFRNERFDIVFMDCNMPELNGWDATREIRTVPSDRMLRVPIVAMTAAAQSADEQLCLAAGMDDHLSKPASLSDLRTMLDRWLPNVSRDAA